MIEMERAKDEQLDKIYSSGKPMFTSAVKQSKLVPCIIFARVQDLGVS